MNPLPAPVPPTAANISKLRVNLKNMQQFNNQLYVNTISKCDNLFVLLSRLDNSDPGMSIGINLLCGALIGVGGEFGIIGCVVANYYCGLISNYSVTSPPSLQAEYTSYMTRIQATSLQVDLDLAIDSSDPVSSWDTPVSGSMDTPWGTKTASCSLGQLAAIDVPDETNPLYDEMMIQAIFAFDQTLWWSVINQTYQINGWNSGWLLPPMIQASDVPLGDQGMNNYCDGCMSGSPAHWSTWGYQAQTDKKGKDTSYYIVLDYSLGYPPLHGKDQPIPDAAARYLFLDTIPGTIVNPNGLFTRVFVFQGFGLRVIEQVA